MSIGAGLHGAIGRVLRGRAELARHQVQRQERRGNGSIKQFFGFIFSSVLYKFFFVDDLTP